MPSRKAERRLAEKWARTPSDHAAIAAGCYFDRAAADHVCDFIEGFLHHSAGQHAGMPFLLQPWQRDYLSRLFGWKMPDGRRRFRETFLEVPKKNGKSTLFSAICLYLLFEEPGAQVFIGARNRRQAATIFDECACMVRSSPSLARHLKIIDHVKTITFAATSSKLVAWSADVASNDGANASGIVLDEVHRFPNRKLYDIAKYAGRARRQPLLVCITTAGFDRHSLCYSLHLRSLAVLDGTVVDLKFLPVIYAAQGDDDLDDPAIWHKANPSLGTLFTEEDFGADLAEARRIPGQLNNFLRLSFNIWTDAATRWLDLAMWDLGLEALDRESLKAFPCYAGLDLSSVKDLTCLSLAFPIGDEVKVLTFAFMPEETAQARADADQVPYPEWIEQGQMIATPGNATDYGAIRALLNALRAEGFQIQRIGIDPWNAAQLANDLMEDEFEVVEVRQGFPTLSGPSKELERLLLGNRIRHDGNKVLRWAVANVAIIHDDRDNIMPSKRRSTERIDPVVSTIIAIGLISAEAPAPKPRITLLSPPEA